ncbi:serine/threonine protein kinase [Aestuariivita boseongensis]|uniref:serine/threonine protein kinase n=1 Tax=Aestuariivita boseongensis TaxID=1470562 RepID=UPI0006800557|nr:serine/threonine-protein kinase [Aestuariivita boseongensis]
MQNQAMHHEDEIAEELLPGTSLLHGQYVIERYLVRGGFGITYLARDSLERRVVVKECYPNAICFRKNGQVVARSRDQLAQFESITRHFLREARRLSRLKHPNIVGVHQVFEENNTAYMALDYLDGIDLLMVIEEEPHRLKPKLIRSLLTQSLRAIDYIHERGILHRDISPDNFLLDWDDNLTLIDFGAAREHVTKAHRALSALLAVKDGYSPQEFYLPGVGQTEASDLYALGATFYHVITGEAPPHSQERLAASASETGDTYVPLVGRVDGFDDVFLGMIDQALAVFPEGRPQSAAEWLDVIEDRAPRAAKAPAPREEAPGPSLDEEPMTRELSRLVQDTNRDLEQGKPGDLKRVHRNMTHVSNPLSPVIPVKKEEKRPEIPVDIFGNPIEDVDKWMREQERALARQAKAEAAALAADAPKGKQRFLKSLISRLVPGQSDPKRSVTN